VADAFGYLGSIGVLFFKEFSYAKVSWLDFFISSGYLISFFGSLLIGGSMFYFHWKHKRWESQIKNAIKSNGAPTTQRI
jgi:hypothetical protein